MRTLKEIDADIEKVQDALAQVHGNEAEVYTRIVGYYRSVRNWNKGKREEYGHRKLFQTSGCCSNDQFVKAENVTFEKPAVAKESFNLAGDKVANIVLYTRDTCPNCPPVRKFCEGLKTGVVEYNVDSEKGFEEARKNGVLSAPTAICYDANGIELMRARSLDELEKVFA